MPDRYCNVSKYIKSVSKPLYELIDNLCADYIYQQSGRRETTFLIPNSDLIKKMKSAKEEDAIVMLKSLVFKGKYDPVDSRDTYNLLGKKVENLSELNKNIKQVNVLWGDNANSKMVYTYSGKDVPASSDSKSGGRARMMQGYGADYDYMKIEGGNDQTMTKRLELSKKLCSDFKSNNDMNLFRKKVASLANFTKQNDQACYDAICDVIDNNPMVTWFLLMEIGKTTNLIVSNKVFKDWYSSGDGLPVNNPTEIYNNCFNSKNETLGDINSIRKNLLQTKCSRVELPYEVVKQYKNMDMSSLSVHMQKVYGQDSLLKLLQDEIRYLFSDEEFYCFNDSMDTLCSMLFKDETKESDLRFCQKDLYDNMVEPKDFFASALVRFVNSQAFLYVPLNADKHSKIQAVSGGGAQGGRITYRGGNLRVTGGGESNDITYAAALAMVKSFPESYLEKLKSDL